MASEMTARHEQRIAGLYPWRPVLAITAIVGVASVAVFLNSPGVYVGDFRFEVAWRPGQTLARLTQLWDTTGGLGRVAGADRSPLPTMLFGLVRGAGVPAWAAQRIWHGALLTVAGTGCLMLVRFFDPRIRTWHLVSALAYMLSPLGLGLFLPSPVYATYAAAPWLMVAVLHGISGTQPWRWAAVFAMAILLTVPVEVPGTIYVAALTPIGAMYLIHVQRRSTWPKAVAWAARVSLLTLSATAFVIIRTLMGRDALVTRLLLTESPETVAATTSWAEAFRGLGHWLTYFALGAEDRRQNFTPFLTNPGIVLATFAVPLIALIALCRTAWRDRLIFALLAGTSLMLAVGFHPIDDPSPFGQIIDFLYREIPSTQAFRNTLKAGAGFAMSTAVLYGASLDWGHTRLSRRRGAQSAMTIAALALLAAASWPAWTGDLYPRSDTVTDIPQYWEEAIDWLDGRPDEGRVLFLPGTSSAVYRWGGPGDDLFEGLLRRPHLQSNVLVTSTPTAQSLTFALDKRLLSAHLPDQSLVPAVRRLGARYVAVRNDLEWRSSSRPRPALLAPIREDPGLRLVKTFGTPGENTTEPNPDDNASETELAYEQYESRLPPVEIYEVIDAVGLVHATANGSDILVAGDGDAWFGLTALGLLETGRPVRYVAELDDDEIGASLRAGAIVVVTDSNVRQVVRATRTSYALGAPLGATDERQGASALFAEVDAQTVSWIPDAVSIDELRPFDGDPWYRPEQAFDDDLTSAWRIPGIESPVGRGIRITLREPRSIGRIELVVADAPNRKIRGGYVELDDRSRIPFMVTDAQAAIDVDDRVSSTISIVIDDADTEGIARVGLAEVRIGTLDLRPVRQVPSDLFARAAVNPILGAVLAQSPMAFVFERDANSGLAATETDLRRRFATDRSRTFGLSGRLRLDQSREDQPECFPWIQLDGADVPVRIVGPSLTLPGSFDFESCEAVDVGDGWHLISGSPEAVIDRVALVESPALEQTEAVAPAQVEVIERGPSRLELDVNVPPTGGVVHTGIAYSDDWRIAVDGENRDAMQLDGQVGLRIAEPGKHRVVITYEPQRLFRLAVLASIITTLGCAALIIGGARQGVGVSPLKPWVRI